MWVGATGVRQSKGVQLITIILEGIMVILYFFKKTLSIYLSIFPSIHPSIYLSINQSRQDREMCEADPTLRRQAPGAIGTSL
jgi:hypothetical protein